jgi:hypothetical protein
MTYASTAQRAALTDGLRALADYLDSNPEVPTPAYTDCYIFPPDSTCAETRAEIDMIAAQLGATAHPTAAGQHYTVTRSSGSVKYHAVAICKGHHHDGGPDDESGQAK